MAEVRFVDFDRDLAQFFAKQRNLCDGFFVKEIIFDTLSEGLEGSPRDIAIEGELEDGDAAQDLEDNGAFSIGRKGTDLLDLVLDIAQDPFGFGAFGDFDVEDTEVFAGLCGDPLDASDALDGFFDFDQDARFHLCGTRAALDHADGDGIKRRFGEAFFGYGVDGDEAENTSCSGQQVHDGRIFNAPFDDRSHQKRLLWWCKARGEDIQTKGSIARSNGGACCDSRRTLRRHGGYPARGGLFSLGVAKTGVPSTGSDNGLRTSSSWSWSPSWIRTYSLLV